MEKKSNHIFTVIILVVGIALTAFAGWNLYSIFSDYHASNQLYDEMENQYVQKNENTTDSTEEDVTESEWYEAITVDLEGLQQENPDVIGWIYFENEEISYPVLYSGDDDTYLRTAMDGSYATAGSIFMEGENTPNFDDSHTILYGHNMKNLSMFGRLKYYKEDDYYEDHMYFQIIRNNIMYRYQIFAYEDVAADSFVYTVPYGPNTSFGEFLDKIYSESYIDSGVVATENDKIITLSTCSAEGKRFVVHAVRVDSHEY